MPREVVRASGEIDRARAADRAARRMSKDAVEVERRPRRDADPPIVAASRVQVQCAAVHVHSSRIDKRHRGEVGRGPRTALVEGAVVIEGMSGG